MARNVGLVISDTDPGSGDNADSWFKPSENKWYQWNGTTWVEVTAPSSITLSPDIVFGGDIYAGEKKGKGEDVTIPGVGKLKFKKGIYTGFTPE